MDPLREPRARLLRQAERCRAAFQALTPEGRAAHLARLEREARHDRIARAWAAVLRGEHPFARWLAGDEDFDGLPEVFPDGLSPRQLVSSHPFTDFHPWFTPKTSAAYSWTRRA